MTKHVEQEIIRLHDFFVEWMTGSVEQTDEEFARFADSIGEAFYIVAPSGHLTRRATLISGLYNTYDQQQNFHIWIENIQVQHLLGEVIVATYEEWQKTRDDGKTTARLSSVVFTKDNTKSNGLLWQCVHETWLPPSN